MKWLGLIRLGRRFLYGSRGEPKARYHEGITGTTSEAYESMNKYYRWFRQDELVRRCLVTNAFFAGLTKGFETVLEPSDPDLTDQEKDRLLEDYGYVKTKIDEYNKRVNLDLVLFVAQIKSSICDKAGFEIVSHDSGQDHDLQKEEMVMQKHHGHPLNLSRQRQKKGLLCRCGGWDSNPPKAGDISRKPLFFLCCLSA